MVIDDPADGGVVFVISGIDLKGKEADDKIDLPAIVAVVISKEFKWYDKLLGKWHKREVPFVAAFDVQSLRPYLPKNVKLGAN